MAASRGRLTHRWSATASYPLMAKRAYCDHRKRLYQLIVASDPNQLDFLAGRLNRLAAVAKAIGLKAYEMLKPYQATFTVPSRVKYQTKGRTHSQTSWISKAPPEGALIGDIMNCKVGTIGFLLGLALSGRVALGECALLPKTSLEEEKAGLCGFNATRRTFSGTSMEQATCLLQTPTIGRSAVSAAVIPQDLLILVGTSTMFTTEQLHTYLKKQKIDETDVGGEIDEKISADYFIIHDTSTPNCSEPKACSVAGKFPPDIDRATWAGNTTFNGHKSTNAPKVTHVMTNRVGQSITEVNFKLHKITTKFEYCTESASKRLLFVAVENIQPRISSSDKKLNDFVAPDPGFTDAQYKRLAQVYVVASIRRGQWLIPANHAVLDWYYANGHDDPQHFDVAQFTAKVTEVTRDLASEP